MKHLWLRHLILLMTLALAVLSGCLPTSPPPPSDGTSRYKRDLQTPTPTFLPTPTPSATSTPRPTPTPPEPSPPPVDPFTLISQDNLFAFMEDLTAIQPYSGWRNSATEGEQEALDYVAGKLGQMEYLESLGLEIERQSFRVFNATELWETRLHLTVDGHEVDIPADGVRGQRDNVSLALRFDSDGTLNDATRDPMVAEGPVAVMRFINEVYAPHSDVEGKVVFLDYATIDPILGNQAVGVRAASQLLALRPAGVVMVTSFSNQPHESHGTFVGDSNPFIWVGIGPDTPRVPILHARLEDMAAAGIEDWDGLARVEGARLTWDADVFAPGTSGNTVARIPGADGSRAVILGAHIDSPNCPGAMDDGSGSVVLLEIARALDAAQAQPPVDLYLAWFGSEEIGLYGSAHFVATHQELLDRTQGMLQIDMLSHPLDGLDADLTLTTWSHGRLGDDRLAWPDYLTQLAARHQIETIPTNAYKTQSDNAVFMGFDVPNANLAYEGPELRQFGPVHYAAHIHNPYDTVELAREVGDVLEHMTRVAMAAAWEAGQADPDLRVAPQPDRRVLFVGAHTEPLMMTPTAFIDLGQTLAMEGFDVDLLPYGQSVAPADLKDAALVVVLPVADYPVQTETARTYDEAWSEEEIAALEDYVAKGGFLVLTNSANRLKLNNIKSDYNEDWRDVNALARRFGVSYDFRSLAYRMIFAEKGAHPLVEDVTYVEVIQNNSVPFTMREGQVLTEDGGHTIAGLVDYGDAGGQVLALADVGIFVSAGGTPQNLTFWRNLVRYARSR